MSGTELGFLSGAFADGYTSEDVDTAARAVWRRYGLILVALWDSLDGPHPTGNSVLGVVEGGIVHGCRDLEEWLVGGGPAPENPAPDVNDPTARHDQVSWGPGFNLYWTKR